MAIEDKCNATALTGVEGGLAVWFLDGVTLFLRVKFN